MLDADKSWLPLKGKTHLNFNDENGALQSFALGVVDSIEDRQGKCSQYRTKFIKATLYLNSSKTDSIFLNMDAPHYLLLRAASNNQPNITALNILAQTSQGNVQRRTNMPLGIRTYSEVVLVLASQGYSRTIDSVYIANNYGLVGFKYRDKKYVLE